MAPEVPRSKSRVLPRLGKDQSRMATHSRPGGRAARLKALAESYMERTNPLIRYRPPANRELNARDSLHHQVPHERPRRPPRLQTLAPKRRFLSPENRETNGPTPPPFRVAPPPPQRPS